MRILFVEDDKALSDVISYELEQAGYSVDCTYDGEEALYLIKQEAYDLIILDRMLPSLDGLSVLKKIRQIGLSTPTIIVTALNGIGDRVIGLDAGADDYLVKPFATEELLARIRALSRRPSQWENINQLQLGDVILDISGQSLSGPSNTCSLSKRETQLFEVFLRHPNKSLPRNIILAKVWGPDAPVEDGNLDNYIHFLRRRLKLVDSKLQLKTIRSVGYCLEDSSSC